MKYYITETEAGGQSRVISWDGWPHEWEDIGKASEALKHFQDKRPRSTFCLVPVTEEGKDIARLILNRNEGDSVNR